MHRNVSSPSCIGKKPLVSHLRKLAIRVSAAAQNESESELVGSLLKTDSLQRDAGEAEQKNFQDTQEQIFNGSVSEYSL